MSITVPILAQASKESLTQLQQAFRNQRPGEVSPFVTTGQFLIVLAVAIAAVYVVIRLTQRQSAPAAAKNPRRFFSQLLGQIGATPLDVFILQRAAKDAELEHPAVMMISPEMLERYAGKWADSISTGFVREFVRARIARIGEAAFLQVIHQKKTNSGG